MMRLAVTRSRRRVSMMTSVSNMIVCPECGGVGIAEYERPVVDYVNGGYLKDSMEVCELCDGYGEIEDDEE